GGSDSTPATTTTPATPPALAHYYLTYGGEAFFPGPTKYVQTSAALYRNQSGSLFSSGAPSQSGTLFYATATSTLVSGVVKDDGTANVIGTILAQYGWGSGTQENGTLTHAYAGEHQGFSPDLIFFTSIVPKTDPSAGIGAGLGNKQYFSLSYTDQ